MCTRKGIPIVLAMAVTVMVAAQALAVSVPMSFYSDVGETRLFRGDLSGLGLGSVTGATVTDAGLGGGTDGVFSGFDLDLVLLDADGNWATTGDRVLPFETAATTVAPGSIRNQATSPYQPTGSHPGSLFGLQGNGSIDFATATIGVRDGSFANPLGVDSSSGWVTLGDNGSLSAAFPQTAIGQHLWLFVGEVGPETTEGLHAAVDIAGVPAIPVPGAILLAGLGVLFIGGLRSRKVL